MDGPGGRRWRAVLVAAFLGGSMLGGSVAAASPGCEVMLNGRSLSAAQTADSAIRLEADPAVPVAWMSDQPAAGAIVRVSAGPLTLLEKPVPDARGTEWRGAVDLARQATKVVGLYQVTVITESCTVQGLVRFPGSPFDTPMGWVSLGLIIGGALGVLGGLLRAFRGRGGPLIAFIAGAVAGAGTLLLSQQSGFAAIGSTNLFTWTVGPGAVSAVAQVVVSAVARTARRAPAPSRPPLSDRTMSIPRPPTSARLPTFGRPPASAREVTIDLDVGVDAAAPPAPPPAAPPTTEPGRVTGDVVDTDVDGPAAGATVGAGSELPRESYARLECPDAVVERAEFEVIVGLMDRPDPRVTGGPMRLPDWVVGPYTMTVQVVADGYALRADESWRLELPVSARDPYPARTLHLTAQGGTAPVRPSSIRAMYSVAGQPIGLAVRSIAVVRDASLLRDAPRQPAGAAISLNLPEGVAPDLTVRIERADSQASGRLLVQLLTADQTIPLPHAPIGIDIGGEPAADLRLVIEQMNKVEGTATQYVTLRGIGLTIADQLPPEFWDVLRQVASRLNGRPPTILFLSAEPYVPWELAVVDPPLDADAPPFLSAQANVGRWVLGQSRPKLPPPAAQTIEAVAVVSGKYDLPGWARLVEAEAEAADIVRDLAASSVDATSVKVLDLLRGQPSADLIHFAVHGNVASEGADDGLILVDGTAFGPLAVRGTPLRGTPFVFLNACQVGQGQQILGDHAGLAEAFLFAGASGVIAPLWSVDDHVARTIALRFYEGALKGETAADILRRERAAFHDSPGTVSTTYLAYQYFGHPGLRFERPRSGADRVAAAPAEPVRATAVTGVN